MLTYIIVAEIGYLTGGAWLANTAGYTGAVYHILADGLMTLCLFMAVGAVIYRTGVSTPAAMQGIFQRMPVTAAVFLIAAASVVGIPPTCGFFSKWYLLQGAVQAGEWVFVAALIMAGLVAAVLFFRLLERAFFGPLDDTVTDTRGKKSRAAARKIRLKEAPLSMLLPMVVTGAALFGLGIYTNEVVHYLIRWSLPPGI
jgi:multicomponent Na+:H+ antiporter subunit D